MRILTVLLVAFLFACETNNQTAHREQEMTEENQRGLLLRQPPPRLSWSLERDNLIKRFKLQNDRSVSFFMYVFIEGVADPVGYYQINKVSSVNSQLTNPEQILYNRLDGVSHVLPSPAEDGSYGTNGDAVFGFTPEDIYIEHNMRYMASTIPLSFARPAIRLAIISTPDIEALLQKSREAMAQ